MKAYDEPPQNEAIPDLNKLTEGFYFATPTLRQRLELLRHLAEFGQQFVLVLADAGCGKSAMRREFVRQLDDTHRVVEIEASNDLSAMQLLDQIAEGLNLSLNSTADEVTAKQQLREHLSSMEQGMVTPMLVVDKVEELSTALIETLLELGQEDVSGTRLRAVLFARPGATAIVQQAREALGHEGLLHKLDIPLFSREESGEFVSQLYMQAGRGINQTQLNDKLDLIEQQTGGHPGEIIRLAEELLGSQIEEDIEDVLSLSSDAQPVSEEKALPVLKIAAGLIFFLLVLVGYYVMQPEGETSSELIPLELPSPPEEHLAISAEQQKPEPPLETVPVELLADEVKEVRLGQDDAPQDEQPQETISLTETLPLEPKVDVPAVPEPLQPVDSETEIKPEPIPVEVIKPPLEPKPEIRPPEPVKAQEPAYRTSTWLLAQAPEKYVLQMLGMYEKQAAQKFLQQQKQQEKFSFFVTRHKSKPWYVVTYGLYPDRAAAVKAITKLPRKLRRLKPWARPIGDIQSLIRKTQQ